MPAAAPPHTLTCLLLRTPPPHPQHSGKAHPSYLHVFIKLADLESVSIKTLMRELSLFNAAVDTPADAASSADVGLGVDAAAVAATASAAAAGAVAAAADSCYVMGADSQSDGGFGSGFGGGFGGMSMAAAVAEALADKEDDEAEPVSVPTPPTTAKSALTDLLAAAEAEARQGPGR